MKAYRTTLLVTAAIIILGALHAADHQVQAQEGTRPTSKVGTTAAQFLKIPVGARAIGMGTAQVAVTGDISAIHWNPASLSRIPMTAEVTFNHSAWLADINYNFAAGAMTIGDIGTLGLYIVLLDTPEQPVRTVVFPEGDGRRYEANSLAIGLTYARNLTDRFSIGFNAKFVQESIWSESATGFAFDVGTLYLSPIKGLSLGAAISNFGTNMRMDGRDLYFNQTPGDIGGGPQNIPSEYRTNDYPMPLQFRVGLAYDYRPVEDIKMIVASDATVPNDNTEYVNLGLELSWREIVFGRIGYKSLFLRDSEQGLTWGLGLHYGITGFGTILLDYGFADYGRLQDVQYLSVGIRL
jgi:hypothetical protein